MICQVCVCRESLREDFTDERRGRRVWAVGESAYSRLLASSIAHSIALYT